MSGGNGVLPNQPCGAEAGPLPPVAEPSGPKRYPAYVRAFIAERDAALKDAEAWKRDYEMYARAWLRELGGKVFNKAHRIDALVLTTRWFREGHDAWERETKAVRQLRADLAAAKTLGLPLEPIIEAYAVQSGPIRGEAS